MDKRFNERVWGFKGDKRCVWFDREAWCLGRRRNTRGS
jgi:hypothetical protein